MRFDEVVKQLRAFNAQRTQVAAMNRAMASLTECERDIIETMIVRPVPRAPEKICEKFDIEHATVYRRRSKAIKKLAIALGELRDTNERNLPRA